MTDKQLACYLELLEQRLRDVLEAATEKLPLELKQRGIGGYYCPALVPLEEAIDDLRGQLERLRE